MNEACSAKWVSEKERIEVSLAELGGLVSQAREEADDLAGFLFGGGVPKNVESAPLPPGFIGHISGSLDGMIRTARETIDHLSRISGLFGIERLKTEKAGRIPR